jgi:16S rRNA (guanine527-N7)-methyltransferase
VVTTPNLDELGWKARLTSGAAELGVPLDEAQAGKLWRLGALLRERNEHVNLTSIVSPEGILTLHVLDSLSIVPDLLEAKTIVDVGTGGGFPGLPLAIACPEREFLLIDGTQKKIRFVTEAIETLGIANAKAVAVRAEDLDQQFDAVIVRAVGSLADVLHNAGHLVAPEGRLIAMKGRHPADELRAVPRGWRAKVSVLRVPGLDAERHVVALTRQKRPEAARSRRSAE